MRLSKKQKQVLGTIGKCSILAASLVAPNLLQLLKYLEPRNPKERYQYKKIINKLTNEKIIYLFGEKIKLTKKGQNLINRIQIEEITIQHSEKWDGVWHLVSYDIPENKKQERDYFRRKILNLGFKVIQDSLWVYPYECKEEIAVICQHLGISPYVAYLNTSHLPQQNKLTNYFKLYND